MAARRLTPAQENALEDAIKADPRYRQAMQIQSLPQRDLALGHLFNTPDSPLYGVNTEVSGRERGTGAYRLDARTGRLTYEGIGPSHWWTDPGVVGPIAVGAATAGTLAFPAAGGGAGAGGAGTGGGINAGVGSLGPAGAPGGALYGAAAPAAGAGGVSAWDRIKDVGKKATGGDGKGMNPFEQAALAALAGLPALFANRGQSPEEKASQEQIKALLDLQRRRIEHQNPLFETITRLAMSRQPTANQLPVQSL